ncbi:hypothetical protein XENTR_v10011456 [Xenopus tropicalis]|uniref:Chromosome 4 C16orf46 homolog n=1 Tax=Xenopus tropicalis TaxID=8364 RepID=A0A6I8QUH3_XENTR|nr:uncharacterized protein C16orf46 homolog [Xenopus tropicalis]XP_031756634.1 uncharacterized protein C16orf46 homolog [Xenopus tropicalis]KAE8608302.1 hypothetical protein XENTR_v10011456 [Xenopus tropicalis]KAE8608303.1 hypothetical protein XENTR_v10011456 [Xenopus tropicalis]KAE8608304.1 hypothetical protein XENTR_v10011456 [Xenopus tropicalis]KAE8608305.1 hypothetical protein XENTR_v10011456 [Xenopus tropicalis]KAE8608306.1 hypothetical protein XENTR_v10011456 [Xenopus tropicalis]|eukprot:XP_012817706.1 PREDICTED: uncharacterized protein C16orf46 homolog [Xenopus tropicalis]
MATQDTALHAEKSESSCQKYCYYDNKKPQRALIEALAETSERLLEDDQKSIEWLIGDGWEEAVCGWGTLSPAVGLFPRKKTRKHKLLDNVSCLICLDICQSAESKNGTPDRKTSAESLQEKLASNNFLTDFDLQPTEKDKTFSKTDHCYSAATVTKTETDCDKVSSADVFTGEQTPSKQSYSESCTSLMVMKEINITPSVSLCANCCNTKDLPVVLPPLKAPAGTVHMDLMLKNKSIPVQQFEKLPSKTLLGSSVYNQVIGSVDLKGDRLVESICELQKEQVKVSHPLSFLTSCLQKSPLRDADHLYWQCAFLANKSVANPAILKQNSNISAMGFLHTRATQNKRSIRHLNEMKSKIRPKSGATAFLDSPLLPSITVTRVAIPVANRPL